MGKNSSNIAPSNQVYYAQRAINFDLDTKTIEKYYIKPYNKAYYQIKAVFIGLGFLHRQGSGYLSIEKIDDTRVLFIAELIANKLPWLSTCLKRIDVTDIVNVHSIKNEIKGATKKPQTSSPKPKKNR